ncbi:MAG: hypothetical protein HY906_03190 [Deltaproteobacteria bacterium]|nr:hypothetical protein [Deltaproteobacteria bacterium]
MAGTAMVCSRGLLVALLAVGLGCSFERTALDPPDGGDDAPTGDAARDAAGDAVIDRGRDDGQPPDDAADGAAADATVSGASGQVGTCSETVAATCLKVAPGGGDCGDGGYTTHAGATGSNGSSGGGGGGGGGAGRIRVRGTTSRTIDAAATVSPAAAS